MSTVTPITLLIPDGESGQALKAIRCLAERGNVTIHVISREKNAPVRHSRHVATFTHFDREKSNDEYLSFLKDAIRLKQATMIFPILEKTIGLIADERSRFEALCRLPLIPESESFRISTDKRLLGQFMLDNDIPAPRTYVFSKDEVGAEETDMLSFPMLAKPGCGGFGRNIKTIKDADALQRFLADGSHDPSDFAVQPFIDGSDIDCSVICKDGEVVAHTIQRTIISAKRKYGPPTGIEFLENPEVLEIVSRLMKLLAWNGVAHVDLRQGTDGKFYVLEINARYWGSLIGSLSAGVNFPAIACALALGEPVEPVEVKYDRYGVGLLTFKARRAQVRAGIPLRNTQLPFMMKDPVPDVVETASLLGRSLLARTRRK